MRRFQLYVAPMVTNSLLRLASIYVTSRFIGPEEFGQAALLLALVTLISTVAGSTTGYLINEYCSPQAPSPRGVVTTVLLVEAIIGTVGYGIVLGGVTLLHDWLPELQILWSESVLLALLFTIWTGSAWSVAVHIVGANGYAGLYFLAMSGSAVASLLASAAYFLFVGATFEGILVGNLAGVVASAATSIIAFNRGHLRIGVRADVLRRAAQLLGLGLVAGASDGGTATTERLTLAHFGGTYAVGLITHAQAYRLMMGTAAKSFQLSSWPTLLRVGKLAAAPPEAIRKIRHFWSSLHLAAGLGGASLAFVVNELVSVLTHGKFVEAAPLIVLYLPSVIVQYSGRLEIAILYGNGHGNLVSRCAIVAAAIFAAIVVPAVWVLGLYGVVLAAFCRELAYRVMVVRYAAHFRDTPFMDQFAIVAVALIVAALLFVESTSLPLGWRIGLSALAAAAGLILALRSVRQLAGLDTVSVENNLDPDLRREA
jgi:O-antigen/teichoic acid export membrane protein